MKRVILAALAVVVIISLCACSYVEITDQSTEIKARFINEDNNIEATLKTEDAVKVSGIFKGKALYGETPPCNFSADFALIIGDNTYCLANDGCTLIYWKEGKKYFFLSADEHKELKAVLNKYGVVFAETEISEE